jgi:hypothetical protein
VKQWNDPLRSSTPLGQWTRRVAHTKRRHERESQQLGHWTRRRKSVRRTYDETVNQEEDDR